MKKLLVIFSLFSVCLLTACSNLMTIPLDGSGKLSVTEVDIKVYEYVINKEADDVDVAEVTVSFRNESSITKTIKFEDVVLVNKVTEESNACRYENTYYSPTIGYNEYVYFTFYAEIPKDESFNDYRIEFNFLFTLKINLEDR